MATLKNQMDSLLSPEDMMLQGLEEGTVEQAAEDLKSVGKGALFSPITGAADVVETGKMLPELDERAKPFAPVYSSVEGAFEELSKLGFTRENAVKAIKDITGVELKSDSAEMAGELIGLPAVAATKAASAVAKAATKYGSEAPKAVSRIYTEAKKIFTDTGGFDDMATATAGSSAAQTSKMLSKKDLPDTSVTKIIIGQSGKDYEQKADSYRRAKQAWIPGKNRVNDQDAQELWNRTGAQEDVIDGDIVYEVPTVNAKLKTQDSDLFDYDKGTVSFTGGKDRDTPVRLSEILDFDELYEQAPYLRDVEVRRISGFARLLGTRAAYNPTENVIYIASGSSKKLTSNLLHEVEHAVQAADGKTYAGGNFRRIMNQDPEYKKLGGAERQNKLNKDAENLINKYSGPSDSDEYFTRRGEVRGMLEILAKTPNPSKFVQAVTKLPEIEGANRGGGTFKYLSDISNYMEKNFPTINLQYSSLIDDAMTFIRNTDQKTIDALIKDYKKAGLSDLQKFEKIKEKAILKYMRDPGEVTARNVQFRYLTSQQDPSITNVVPRATEDRYISSKEIPFDDKPPTKTAEQLAEEGRRMDVPLTEEGYYTSTAAERGDAAESLGFTNVRKTRAEYERTKLEQSKRQELLSDPNKLAVYAAEKEIPVADMRKLLSDNFERNKTTLEELERVVSADDFIAAENEARKRGASLGFKNVEEQTSDAFTEFVTPLRTTGRGPEKKLVAKDKPIMRVQESIEESLSPRMKRAMDVENFPEAASILPAPGRFFDPARRDYKEGMAKGLAKAGIELDLEFGNYIMMGKGKPTDVSNETFENLFISPRTSFKRSQGTNTSTARANQFAENLSIEDMKKNYKQNTGKEGKEINTNLLQPERFKVISNNEERLLDHPIIAVQPKSGKHYYTLDTQFVGPVNMKRMTDKVRRKLKSGEIKEEVPQPNLRPATVGDVRLGNVVGEIKVGSKTHSLYDYIEVDAVPSFSKGKSNIEKFKQGGAVPMNTMSKQMELFEPVERGFEEGGLMDEGGMVDEMSGNEVPPGSLREEVRDDIPAQLSEGEFVFPADVVRYIGLEKLMRMRQQAKMGLKRMEEMGQMGNSEEAIMPDDLPFTLDDLDMEDEEEYNNPQEFARGGVVYAQQGTFVNPDPQSGIYYQPPSPITTGIAQDPVVAASAPAAPMGGYTPPQQAFTPVRPPQELTPTFQSVVGFGPEGVEYETVTYVNEAGQTLVLKKNKQTGQLLDLAGNPASIPEGYKLKGEEEEEVAPVTTQTTQVTQQGDGGGRSDDVTPGATIAFGGTKATGRREGLVDNAFRANISYTGFDPMAAYGFMGKGFSSFADALTGGKAGQPMTLSGTQGVVISGIVDPTTKKGWGQARTLDFNIALNADQYNSLISRTGTDKVTSRTELADITTQLSKINDSLAGETLDYGRAKYLSESIKMGRKDEIEDSIAQGKGLDTAIADALGRDRGKVEGSGIFGTNIGARDRTGPVSAAERAGMSAKEKAAVDAAMTAYAERMSTEEPDDYDSGPSDSGPSDSGPSDSGPGNDGSPGGMNDDGTDGNDE